MAQCAASPEKLQIQNPILGLKLSFVEIRYLVIFLIPSARSPFKMHGGNLFRTRIQAWQGAKASQSHFPLHGFIFLFMGTSSLHGHIFPFIGTSSPSLAHLPFMGASSPSLAHLPLHGHIFPFIGASSLHGRIFPFIGTPSSAHLPLREHIHHGNAFCAEMVIVLVIVENRKHFRKKKFHDITPCKKYRTSDNIPVLSI